MSGSVFASKMAIIWEIWGKSGEMAINIMMTMAFWRVYMCTPFFPTTYAEILSLTSNFLSSVILMNNDMLMTITSSGHIWEYLAIISIICYHINYQHVPTLISSQFWLDDLHHLSSSSNLVSIFFWVVNPQQFHFFTAMKLMLSPCFPCLCALAPSTRLVHERHSTWM